MSAELDRAAEAYMARDANKQLIARRRRFGGWLVLTLNIRGIVHHHATPENDYKPHYHDPEIACWCKPHHDPSLDLFDHNAMDGRERHEYGAGLQ